MGDDVDLESGFMEAPPPCVEVEVDNGCVRAVLLHHPPPRKSYRLERGTCVLLDSGPEEPYPFIGVISKIKAGRTPEETALSVIWLYRTADVRNLLDREPPKALLQCPGGGELAWGLPLPDSGECKEVFMSCHQDQQVPLSVIHPVKVHFLPGYDATGVQLQPPGAVAGGSSSGGGSGSSDAGGQCAFLPGFICRRLVDVQATSSAPRSMRLFHWLGQHQDLPKPNKANSHLLPGFRAFRPLVEMLLKRTADELAGLRAAATANATASSNPPSAAPTAGGTGS